MREKFFQYGLPSPKFIEVSTSSFSPTMLSALSFPLVVKPVDNMGARGCLLVQDESAIVDAIEKAHEIKEYLEDKYPDIAIEIDAISPVISTHLGLGAIGFGWTIL